MNAVVDKALALWGMSGAEYSLVAARENAVYRINSNTGTLALRLHRHGYRTDQELWSELKWMDAVAQAGIIVPAPIAAISGDVLHIIDGTQVDVLTWLSGRPVSDIIETLNPKERTDLFHKIGSEMARLHLVSDAWSPPDGFVRCTWGKDGLLGRVNTDLKFPKSAKVIFPTFGIW